MCITIVAGMVHRGAPKRAKHALYQEPPEAPNISLNRLRDNGSQYVSAQFKTFLRDAGCAHSKARVRHPQSNGKIERWHKSIKTECVRRTALGDLEEARAVVATYVLNYNTVRLHSAINYLTPADGLLGPVHIAAKLAHRKAVFEEADDKRRAYWKAMATA